MTQHTLKGQTFDSPHTNIEAMDLLGQMLADGRVYSTFIAGIYARLKQSGTMRANPIDVAWIHRVVIDKSSQLDTNKEQTMKQLVQGQQPARPTPQASLASVIALFDKAHESGLKHPAIHVTVEGNPLCLKRCGAKSKYAGEVHASNGAGFNDPDNVYFGRVDRTGKFHPAAGSTPAVAAILEVLSKDPAAFAAAYGRKTGNCCFCNAKLEDERSTVQGYGPVCAKKWGLAWGERPEEVTKAGKGRREAVQADVKKRLMLKPEVSAKIEQPLKLTGPMREVKIEQTGGRMSGLSNTAAASLLAAGAKSDPHLAKMVQAQETGFVCVTHACPNHRKACGKVCPTCKASAKPVKAKGKLFNPMPLRGPAKTKVQPGRADDLRALAHV
jgi:hypothetical protein